MHDSGCWILRAGTLLKSMPSLAISAVAVGDGGQSEAAPMGFTVTAASVGDYRPRLDRRVARSKARPADREVKRKEAWARSNEASTLTDGVLTYAGWRPRSKACRRKKERNSPSTWKAVGWDEGDVSKPGEKQRENERTRERTGKEGMWRKGERWPRASNDINERVAGNAREKSECIFAVIALEKRRIYTLGVFC